MFLKKSPIMSKGCRFQSICCMSEYEDRSYEELRSEYYEAYKRWRASFRPAMLFFGIPIFPFSSKNEQPPKRIFIPPVQYNSKMNEYADVSFEELNYNDLAENKETPQLLTTTFKTAQTPLFGASASTSALGNQQTTPFAGFNAATNGTTIKFNPTTGIDTMMKRGVSTNISTRHQCITRMKEYENKSLEELRMEDYAANRKGPQAGISDFGNTGQTGLFGAPASTSAFSFGNTQTKPLFGNTTSFGTTSTSGSVFGNRTQQNTILSFGINTQQQTSTPFGTSNTSFGTPYPMFGEVGSTSTGLFQQSKNNGTSFSFNNTRQASSSMPFGTNNTSTFGTPVLTFGETGNTSAATGLWGQSANKSANFSGFTSPAKPTTSGAIFETNTQYTFPIFGKNNTSTFGTSTPTFGGTSNTNEVTGLWGQSPNKTATFPGFPSPNQTSTSDSNFSTNAQQTSSATSFATDTTSIFGTPISNFGVIGCTSTSKVIWSQGINVNNNSSLVSSPTQTSTSGSYFGINSAQQTSSATPSATNSNFIFRAPISLTLTAKGPWDQSENASSNLSDITTPIQTSTSGSYFSTKAKQTSSAANSAFNFQTPVGCTPTAKGSWGQSGNASSNFSGITIPTETSTSGSYFSTNTQQTSSATPSTTNSNFIFRDPISSTPTAKGPWGQSGNANSNLSGITTPTQTSTSGSYFGTNIQQTSSATPSVANSTFVFRAPVGCTPTAKGSLAQSGNVSSNFCGLTVSTKTSANTVNNWANGRLNDLSTQKTSPTTPLVTNNVFRTSIPTFVVASGTSTGKEQLGQSRNSDHNLSGSTSGTISLEAMHQSPKMMHRIIVGNTTEDSPSTDAHQCSKFRIHNQAQSLNPVRWFQNSTNWH